MRVINNYKELNDLIKMNQNILDQCKENLLKINKHLIKNNCPSGYSSGTSYVDADCIHGSREELHPDMLQNLIDEGERYRSMIFLQEEILNGLKETKNKTDNILKNLKGIEYRITYLQYVEGYSYQQIASELGYTYQYIRLICAKINKQSTDNK